MKWLLCTMWCSHKFKKKKNNNTHTHTYSICDTNTNAIIIFSVNQNVCNLNQNIIKKAINLERYAENAIHFHADQLQLVLAKEAAETYPNKQTTKIIFRLGTEK